MTLIRLPADAGVDEILGHIEEHGYCVVERLVSPEIIEQLNQEMAPHLAAGSYGVELLGAKTRRIGGLLARSPASHKLIANPKVLAVADRHLSPAAGNFQLSLTMLNCLGPGEKPQGLHRDEMVWGFPFPVDYPIGLNTVWALDDFTKENGGTRVFPGSHKSDLPMEAYNEEDAVIAVMPKGSAIIYSGKLVHAAGGNSSQATRSALLVDYAVGWVRQEENQFLSTPIEVARTFPREVQKLMGYDMGAIGIGHAFSFEHPLVALYPEWSPLPCTSEPPPP